jgi:hypothetical protein
MALKTMLVDSLRVSQYGLECSMKEDRSAEEWTIERGKLDGA